MRMIRLLGAGLGLWACFGMPSISVANDYESQIREVFEQRLKSWFENPLVIEAIRKQNREHAAVSSTEIDAMDKEWRRQAKTGGGPLIERLLTKEASVLLAKRMESSNELVTEVFVMDNKGMNVAQSVVTSDYMQGDEAKWQKTYGTGVGEVFVDDIEFDDSTESFQSQVSATITDPSTGKPIGAVTFGINIEML